jgi:hypothetical protein
LLQIADPVYHQKREELVASRLEATKRLAAVRNERDRVLSILALREDDARSKVKTEEKESLETLNRLWVSAYTCSAIAFLFA